MTTCSYLSQVEAVDDREVLRKFGVESELLEYPTDDGGITWEVRTKEPTIDVSADGGATWRPLGASVSAGEPPLHIASGHYIEDDPGGYDDLDDRHVSSHWDDEAEDREYRMGRGGAVHE